MARGGLVDQPLSNDPAALIEVRALFWRGPRPSKMEVSWVQQAGRKSHFLR